MSNLIKYYKFNVTSDDKRLLDNDEHISGFIPGLKTFGQIEVNHMDQEEFNEDFPEEMFSEECETVEETPEELLAMAHEQAGEILERAQVEADKLLEQARVAADFEKKNILEMAKSSGYKDGLVQANDELASQRKELEARREELEQEYAQLVEELEPNFVKLVIGLIQKLTGVIVEEKSDIVLYLMEQSLKGLGKTSMLNIRVSVEDYALVCEKELELRELIPEGCQLEIERDDSLVQNQCIIEADKQIIDCSLDVQMKGLIEDLKMMM